MKPLTPGLELGARFVLVRRIAEGGTAEVWLAEDREAGRRVALKVFDAAALTTPGAMARLRESLALSARLDPGQAVGVLGLHELDGRVTVAMEYLSGGDLGQFRGRPFAVFARPLVELAGLLSTAHERGIVHRDLKCANVLLDSGGRVRLADFGLAAVAGAPAAVASPYNMSPQQLRGEPAAPADDLYAFGAMLYELLSGHPPFYPDINRDLVLHEPVPPLVPRFPAPEPARELALRLLSKSADSRPASMEEVRGVLEAALQEPEEAPTPRPAAAAPPSPAGPAQGGPPPQRLRRGGLAVVALAAAAGLALVFLWLPGRVAERGAAGAQQATEAALAEAERARRAQASAEDLERARIAAIGARDAFEAKLTSIEQQAAAVWATATLAAAREQARDGERAFDLGEYADEPIAVAFFGRGRVLPPLVAGGITAENILGDCSYLCGACSCQVKRENPGIDALFTADWDAALGGGTVVVDKILPPLTGAGDIVAANNPHTGTGSPSPVAPQPPPPHESAYPAVVRYSLPITIGAAIVLILIVGLRIKRRPR